MKQCIHCKETKDLGEFYTHQGMSDGKLNACKECCKERNRRNFSKNREYYRQYDRKRFQENPKVRARHRKYRQTEAGKLSIRKAHLNWISQNPKARKAHIDLNNAVKYGLVEKPKSCSKCGEYFGSRKLHGHHDNYDRPLDVTWLCLYCHVKEHSSVG